MASWMKKEVGLALNLSAGKELVCSSHYTGGFLKKKNLSYSNPASWDGTLYDFWWW
jgi:hypothetical protein